MSILIRPVISEKAGVLAHQGKYVFQVNPRANTPEIKKEIEKLYKVKVASVNVINLKGKSRRRGRTVGRTSDTKKAIVTLVPGQSIQGLTEPA